MLDTILAMLKLLFCVAVMGIPIAAAMVLIKNKVEFKPVTIEMLKFLGGIVFIVFLIYLSFKG